VCVHVAMFGIFRLLMRLCVCVCECVCAYEFIHKRKEERRCESALLYKRNRITWRQSPELVCVCPCVFVCACQPFPAQYPSIQPTPGTMVHPSRRRVALFISETHSACVCVCVCVQVGEAVWDYCVHFFLCVRESVCE